MRYVFFCQEAWDSCEDTLDLNKLKVNLRHGEGIDIRLRVTVKEIQVCRVDITVFTVIIT